MNDNNLITDVALVSRIEAIGRILEVVCRVTDMGFAAVARVTDTQWIACEVRDDIAFGLRPGDELVLKTTICDEIRDSRRMVVIDHVDADPQFASHHTPRQYGFQSYISTPIYRNGGQFFGTLCAIHPHPRSLNRPEITEMFKLFADLIGFHLDAQEQLAESRSELSIARADAELREQFIAVLGHDLRNPLSSIAAGAAVIRKQTFDVRVQSVLTRMDKSVLRISGLISNILDFARGRLGGGFSLARRDDVRLPADLEQVVAELRAAWPERHIEASLLIDRVVNCDRARLAQMLSNLLGNALAHGDPDAPIQVVARTDDQNFELSVSNQGESIAAHMLERLFKPFFRNVSHRDQEGLGLGLFIVQEIARAHGGTLAVVSTSALTRFTFTMPLESEEHYNSA